MVFGVTLEIRGLNAGQLTTFNFGASVAWRRDEFVGHNKFSVVGLLNASELELELELELVMSLALDAIFALVSINTTTLFSASCNAAKRSSFDDTYS